MTARNAIAALAALGLAAAAAVAARPAPPRATAAVVAPDTTAGGWRLALAPYAFRFPRDHAAHPAYRTEWWYYTGELRSGARTFGFELTFFRVGIGRADAAEQGPSASAWRVRELVLAHAALTDEARRTFVYDEVAARPALGLAGADSARYRVWAGGWSAGLAADGVTHALRAATPRFALDLALVPRQPPAVHGAGGVSAKGAERGAASHYYSIPRLAVTGRLARGRDTLTVAGEAWMDHEFSSSVLAPSQAGWDWFAVRLDDGRALMLYVLRRTGGAVEPASSGSLITADGRVTHLPLGAFEARATGRWRSPRSGAVYPHGWRVRVPGAALDLALEPTVDDQELVTASTGGVTYWEGAVRVRGTAGGRAVAGRGYVELTGYAGPPPGR